MSSHLSEIKEGDSVRVKNGQAVGRVLRVDPMTYICTVSWQPGYVTSDGGQSAVHRMSLEHA